MRVTVAAVALTGYCRAVDPTDPNNHPSTPSVSARSTRSTMMRIITFIGIAAYASWSGGDHAPRSQDATVSIPYLRRTLLAFFSRTKLIQTWRYDDTYGATRPLITDCVRIDGAKVALSSPSNDGAMLKKNAKKNTTWNGAHRSRILFGMFVGGYLMYVVAGAMFYHVLETRQERVAVDFVANARVTRRNLNSIFSDDLNDFERALKFANGITNCATCNGTYESNWTIGKSIFFVGTLLTTIGYGHITPQTEAGKMFTIAYATIGIPLTLILLSAFVERLFAIVMTFLLRLTTKLSDMCGPLPIRLIHLAIMLFFMVTGFLLIPAIVISYIESDWGLLNAFYYCFVSLTTIGLGDFIAGDSINQQYRDVYKIILTVYLYIGTTMMMLTLAIFYDIPEINNGHLFTVLEKGEDIDGKGYECERDMGDAERSLNRAKTEMIVEKARLSRNAFQNGLDPHLSTNYINESLVLTKNLK